MKRFLSILSLPVAMAITGCGHSQDKTASAPAAQPVAPVNNAEVMANSPTDVRNTICPVSGDKVETSRLTRTYDGKVYHLCCADCIKPFEKDPEKYAKAVAADPAKYGVAPAAKP